MLCDSLAVIALAVEAHAGQVRKYSGLPYVLHPLRVARRMRGYGFDSVTLSAAMLHDVLEDTTIPESRIVEVGGPETLDLVQQLTNRSRLYPWMSRRDRKRIDLEWIRKAATPAKVIKLVDRADNLWDIPLADETEGFRYTYAQESKNLLACIGHAHAEAAERLKIAIERAEGGIGLRAA